MHAIELRWKQGVDEIAVIPYRSGIAESGRAFASMSTLNLSVLDGKRVNAEFKSTMLGRIIADRTFCSYRKIQRPFWSRRTAAWGPMSCCTLCCTIMDIDG